MTSTAFILDFDRCLGNESLYKLFDEIVAGTNSINTKKLKTSRDKVEAEGESFDTLHWLRGELGDESDVIKRVLDEYIRRADERGNETFLSPGAKELLAYLRDSHIPNMIMTYGGNEYQTLKLRAAGLQNVPTEIVANKAKAVYIARWWDDVSRKFIVPLPYSEPIRVDMLVLIDDKAQSFCGLPEQASGYWVRDDTHIMASQAGVVPVGVKVCNSLVEVLEDIAR